ncbi:MAG: glycosyltransferase family 2 protein [Flavobacteriales bacterium]|nr:glycosyltransferase family 2 protein [Flavobacteriales bacterium]
MLISGIITTYNEEENIEAALASMSWVDEMIVVDSFSTDKTMEIAKQNGAAVFQRIYVNPADQKNWIIPQAKNPWIFILDADERCTAELRSEIQNKIEHGPKCDAYWIPRANIFMGKKVRFSGWQGDKVIRFFKRDMCRYNDKWVHEEIETSGSVCSLKSKMVHNTYKDIQHYEEKMQRYAEYAVQDLLRKKRSVGFFHLYIKPAARFIKHYFIDLGILDGKVGYIISKMSARSVFLKYSRLKDHLNQTD